MKKYELVVQSWLVHSPNGAHGSPQQPGPEWHVVGFSTAGAGSLLIGTVVYERELEDAPVASPPPAPTQHAPLVHGEAQPPHG